MYFAPFVYFYYSNNPFICFYSISKLILCWASPNFIVFRKKTDLWMIWIWWNGKICSWKPSYHVILIIVVVIIFLYIYVLFAHGTGVVGWLNCCSFAVRNASTSQHIAVLSLTFWSRSPNNSLLLCFSQRQMIFGFVLLFGLLWVQDDTAELKPLCNDLIPYYISTMAAKKLIPYKDLTTRGRWEVKMEFVIQQNLNIRKYATKFL